jgi:hypothetical protein
MSGVSSLASAHEVADELLHRHRAVFGADLNTYSGHVHRVIGLVGLQCAVPAELAAPLGHAAFFHDSAIWFDGTWDYLGPSAERALAELSGPSAAHAELVTSLITEHHRLSRAHHSNPLVEAFRRADLTDVTAGLIGSPGVPREQYRDLARHYPARGFRPMLLRAFGKGLREAPLRPIPMIKL